MAKETSGVFDYKIVAAEKDRVYPSAFANGLIRAIVGDQAVADGIGSRLSLSDISDGAQLKVRLSDGVAFVAGAYYRLFDDGTGNTLDLNIDPETVGLNRKDRVILEFSSADSVRAINAKILKGNPAVNPVAPTLTRDNVQDSKGVFQISLYTVDITGGNLNSVTINDQRPFVRDLDNLNDTINLILNGDISVGEADFAENAAKLDGVDSEEYGFIYNSSNIPAGNNNNIASIVWNMREKSMYYDFITIAAAVGPIPLPDVPSVSGQVDLTVIKGLLNNDAYIKLTARPEDDVYYAYEAKVKLTSETVVGEFSGWKTIGPGVLLQNFGTAGLQITGSTSQGSATLILNNFDNNYNYFLLEVGTQDVDTRYIEIPAALTSGTPSNKLIDDSATELEALETIKARFFIDGNDLKGYFARAVFWSGNEEDDALLGSGLVKVFKVWGGIR